VRNASVAGPKPATSTVLIPARQVLRPVLLWGEEDEEGEEEAEDSADEGEVWQPRAVWARRPAALSVRDAGRLMSLLVLSAPLEGVAARGGGAAAAAAASGGAAVSGSGRAGGGGGGGADGSSLHLGLISIQRFGLAALRLREAMAAARVRLCVCICDSD
jgi:hypothetical protein